MPSLDTTFGASFDGFTVSLILFGVTCGQAIRYYRAYPKDNVRWKLLVGVTWLLDTLHLFLVSHSTWHYLIARISLEDLETANWSMISQVVPTECIAVAVDCFFIRRIWLMSDRDWRTLPLLIPTFLAFAVSIAYVVKCFRLPLFVDAAKSTWLLGLFSSCRAAVDLAIAIWMCYLLFTKRTGFKRTQSVIRTLVHFTVATGCLTSFVTTCYIISFFTMQNNMIYIGIYFVHGKVYLNSMLAALNSRAYLRERAFGNHGMSDYTSGFTSNQSTKGTFTSGAPRLSEGSRIKGSPA